MMTSLRPSAWLAELRTRARALFRRRATEQALSEEIRFHLEMETEANVRRGMPPDEARRAALIAFGGVERVREDHRDARGTRLVDDAIADLRYSARWLSRSPAFTLPAILTLALGVGGATAVVCVVDGVLLRPLPYPHAERLAVVWSLTRGEAQPWTTSPPDFRAFREGAGSFERLGAYYDVAANLILGGEPVRLAAARASAEVFPLLGVPPLLGRVFRADEEVAGNDRVVILSHALWRDRFGGSRAVVGSPLTIDGAPHTIVGVMPASFRFPDRSAELWLPMAFAPGDVLDTRGNYFLSVVGRLLPGVSLERARSDLDRIAARIAAADSEASLRAVEVESLHEEVVGDSRAALLLLLAAAGLLLAITCANVAGLLLARAAGRRRELALRAGLGATRMRLVRQLLTEGLLLSTAGGAAGVALGWLALQWMRTSGPRDLPRMDEIALDGRVLGLALAITVLTGVAFALMPALRLTRSQDHEELRGGVRLSGPAGHRRLRRLLVGGQVALALVLLIGSGLLLRSFVAMTRVDPGFRAAGLVTASLPITGASYADSTRVRRFADELLARVTALPGVESAALTSGLSLRGGGWVKRVTFGDRSPPTSLDQVPAVWYRLVSHDYFRTLGVRVVAGRGFEPTDRRGGPAVAVVNEAMAKRFWPGGSPVGKTVWMGPPEPMVASLLPPGFRFPRLTVVGVVADERFDALDTPPNPEVYQLYTQSGEVPSSLYLAVRSARESPALIADLRGALHQVDPTLPLAQIATAGELVRESSAKRRFGALLVTGFATLALALSLVGVYGVATQFVAQRRRELAIRLALGADDTSVMRLVLREGLATALAGALAGLGTAFALGGIMRDVIFQVSPADPATYVASAGVLLASVVLASFIPARRASRLPPAEVLAAE
ncbi:MAG TPA: ABC transporter permease [Gemmatimonadales bacterium]|nr:ABC transporter permease [Gemmatimonadales bacterium]